MTRPLPVREPGQEIVEITPVILGGSPTDPSNKTVVTREQHFELVRYWNRIIKEERARRGAAADPPGGAG